MHNNHLDFLSAGLNLISTSVNFFLSKHKITMYRFLKTSLTMILFLHTFRAHYSFTQICISFAGFRTLDRQADALNARIHIIFGWKHISTAQILSHVFLSIKSAPNHHFSFECILILQMKSRGPFRSNMHL